MSLWAGLGVVVVIVAVVIAAAIYMHKAEPMLKQKVVETLATRYDSRVELATFGVSVWDGFEVTGTGLRLYPNKLQMTGPMIAVKKFSFRIDWPGLLRNPIHVAVVRIHGMDIHLPPKQQRGKMPSLDPGSGSNGASGSGKSGGGKSGGSSSGKSGGGKSGNSNSGGSSGGKLPIVVDRLEVDHAVLKLGKGGPGKVPLTFQINQLELRAVGTGHPMQFHAKLINPKPVGKIDTTGSFGPFDEHHPGGTRVSGSYQFSHADLGTFKGIGGILSSTGKYKGTLNHLTVDGETDTPDFSLDTAGHPLPLHTKFHAIVDGTNGDTRLEPVDATLAHSHIVARGDVVSVAGKGHNITLDVTVQPGRLEDMLTLAAKTEPPVMTGNLVMHTKLHLPPGPASVTKKLRLKGNFSATDVHFTDAKLQGKVDQLSLRARGEPDKANKDAAHTIHVEVKSKMKGHFTLDNRRITITGLHFVVPGANIALSGTYGLNSSRVNFHGTARLKANVSQMVSSWWKSLLLKPVDPFLSKNGAGTEVPIQITGTRKDLSFGLDYFGGDGKGKKQ